MATWLLLRCGNSIPALWHKGRLQDSSGDGQQLAVEELVEDGVQLLWPSPS
jgi:hypothetical protein